MKALAWFLIGFCIVFLFGITSANAGYWGNGKCHATSLLAVRAQCQRYNDNSDGEYACIIHDYMTASVIYKINPATSTYTYVGSLSVPPYCDETLTSTNPFDLTPSEGAQIAGAILLLWAIGYGVRLLLRTLNTGDNSTERNEE
jgi:hypothetical protein